MHSVPRQRLPPAARQQGGTRSAQLATRATAGMGGRNGRLCLTSIGALLDPEAIIVGGGTAEAGEDLLDPVRELVAREVSAPPLIIACALGSDAQLFGAVFRSLEAEGRHDGPRHELDKLSVRM